MPVGTVKWFSAERGFGFIRAHDGGDDVFVRFSNIDADGFRSLNKGDRVAYQLASEGNGKPEARGVRPATSLDDGGSAP